MTETDQSQRMQTTKTSHVQSENKCRQACVKNVRSLWHYKGIGQLPNGAIFLPERFVKCFTYSDLFTFLGTRKQLLNLANGRRTLGILSSSLYSFN